MQASDHMKVDPLDEGFTLSTEEMLGFDIEDVPGASLPLDAPGAPGPIGQSVNGAMPGFAIVVEAAGPGGRRELLMAEAVPHSELSDGAPQDSQPTYECGYCGTLKSSQAAGSDGKGVRIRCPCGAKYGDKVPRMHANWKRRSSSGTKPFMAKVISVQPRAAIPMPR